MAKNNNTSKKATSAKKSNTEFAEEMCDHKNSSK